MHDLTTVLESPPYRDERESVDGYVRHVCTALSDSRSQPVDSQVLALLEGAVRPLLRKEAPLLEPAGFVPEACTVQRVDHHLCVFGMYFVAYIGVEGTYQGILTAETTVSVSRDPLNTIHSPYVQLVRELVKSVVSEYATEVQYLLDGGPLEGHPKVIAESSRLILEARSNVLATFSR